MKVFFTKYKEKEIHENTDCNAIDIWMENYTLRVRENGILIKDNKTQEILHDIDLKPETSKKEKEIR